MTKKTQSRYTTEETILIKEKYKELGNQGISEIAKLVGKTEQSVRSKLVRESVYIKSDKNYRPKKTGPSKKEIIRDLSKFGLDSDILDGLKGATKPALLEVKTLIESLTKEAV